MYQLKGQINQKKLFEKVKNHDSLYSMYSGSGDLTTLP